jgi:hypothetical protein
MLKKMTNSRDWLRGRIIVLRKLVRCVIKAIVRGRHALLGYRDVPVGRIRGRETNLRDRVTSQTSTSMAAHHSNVGDE